MQYSVSTAASQNNFVCDSPKPLTDFDATKYVGTWFEIDHVLG